MKCSHEVMGPDAMILVFWMLSFKPTFSLSSFLSSRGSLDVSGSCFFWWWLFVVSAGFYFETIHSGVSQLLCCDASIHQFQSVTSLKTLTSPGLCSVGAFGSGTWLQLFGRPGPTPTPNSISSVQFSRSVVSDSLRPHESQHARPPCPSPTPGVQTQVHWVGDAIQPSHPVSSPSPPAFKPSQHQSLFQWVNSSHEVAKVLEFQL